MRLCFMGNATCRAGMDPGGTAMMLRESAGRHQE